jgi:hypothetical protein
MTTRYFVRLALLLGGALGFSQAVSAASAQQALTYRGLLTDNGAPADGRYDLQFALYETATDGSPIDTVDARSLDVRDGALVAPLPFADGFGGGSARWVEARMRAAGSDAAYEVLTPRQQVAAATGPVMHSIAGTNGAGESYDVEFASGTLFNNSQVLLATINVPAGAYVAMARLQVQTGAEADPGNNYRIACDLSPGFDSSDYRVGEESSVERYLTWQGAATLASPGPIQFACYDPNSHTETVLGGKLTVMTVGSVN